jgi:hypothetical protein
MLPTFVVIGAMKTGSSSLANYLGSHPQVFMSTPKEPSYFAARQDRTLAWYRSLFEGAGDAIARGEASTAYTKAPHFPDCSRRMAELLPDARLIYLVRHPVPRIRSQYVHNCAHQGERRSIDVAVRQNPDYLAFSRYAYQLERFLEHFPRDQLLVLATEQLKSQREEVLKEVLQFIGVDPDVTIANLHEEFNRGDDKRRTLGAVALTEQALRKAHVLRYIPWKWRQKALASARVGKIKADVTPDLAAWIWDELAEDRERFYRLVPEDFPKWSAP